MAAQSYDITKSGPNPWYVINNNGSITDLGNFGTTTKYIDRMAISSVSTPGWGKLNKRTRSLVKHNYQKQYTNLKEFNGNFSEFGTYFEAGVQKQAVYRKNFNFACFINSGFPDLAQANSEWMGGDLSQRVDNKLLKKLSEESQSSSWLVTLAEANKTAAMVASTATRLRDALKALPRGRFGDFFNALGITATQEKVTRYGKRRKKVLYDLHMTDPKNGYMEAKRRHDIFDNQKAMYSYHQRPEFQKFCADTWLEYSYGWLPLLADIDDSMKALARHSVERSNIVHRVVATVEFENPKVFKSLTQNGYTQVFERVEKRKERLVVEYYKPESILNALNNFGILNPLEVAWELIPFSFVADWFFPVGQALRNLTSTIGLEFKGGARTRHTSATATSKVFGNGKSYEWNGVGSKMVCNGFADRVIDTFEIKRTILVTFPSAHFPAFKDPRGIEHGISAISLLSNMFLARESGSTRNLRL